MRLKGKVVCITGGAAGIGKATALRFAQEGARVVICDLNADLGREILSGLGEGHAFYQVDVTNRQVVQEWIDQVVDEFGKIDVLINNAGILKDGTLVKVKDRELVKQMPEENFDLVISVNLKGVFNCTQAAVPYMIRQGGGGVINASSVVGLDGNLDKPTMSPQKPEWLACRRYGRVS
jgi:3-oxoacyl-[acyl-carrier protein] reductase